MIKKAFIVLSLVLVPTFAFAQQPMNELGVFISTSQFDDAELQDGLDTIEFEFDEDMGYGLLFNRFWTQSFSTEFAYQKLGADLTVSFEDIVENAGDIDLDILSATGQFHFLRGGFLSPYVGGGVAYVSGQAGGIDQNEIQDIDLEKELDWLVNAGLNLKLGASTSIFVDGKYVMYEARAEGDPDEDAVDINPLILSAGLRFRF